MGSAGGSGGGVCREVTMGDRGGLDLVGAGVEGSDGEAEAEVEDGGRSK